MASVWHSWMSGCCTGWWRWTPCAQEISIIDKVIFHCFYSGSLLLIAVFNLPPLHHFDKLLSHEETTADSLSHGDQRCQLFISHLLKGTQETSLEEHLNDHKRELYYSKHSIRNDSESICTVNVNLHQVWGSIHSERLAKLMAWYLRNLVPPVWAHLY